MLRKKRKWRVRTITILDLIINFKNKAMETTEKKKIDLLSIAIGIGLGLFLGYIIGFGKASLPNK